ncbi:MAG: endonuclease domain-containing protein [Mycobacteriales bacterium]
MNLRRDVIRSHQSAALGWGLPLVAPPGRQHVTLPRNASRVVLPGVRIHRADLPPQDVQLVHGRLMTTPLRTVLDLGRTLPLPEALGLVDAALRTKLVRRSDLQARAAVARGTGSGRLGRTVALADARSESFLESRCRGILIQAGLAPEKVQHVIYDDRGRWIGRVDFAWPSRRVVVEVDGFAFHADRAAYRNDRRRLNSLGLAGWLVLRFTWEDVVTNPDAVCSAVAAALEVVTVAA